MALDGVMLGYIGSVDWAVIQAAIRTLGELNRTPRCVFLTLSKERHRIPPPSRPQPLVIELGASAPFSQSAQPNIIKRALYLVPNMIKSQ